MWLSAFQGQKEWATICLLIEVEQQMKELLDILLYNYFRVSRNTTVYLLFLSLLVHSEFVDHLLQVDCVRELSES